MYVQSNKKVNKSGKVYYSYLLCKKYRENKKIKTKSLLNLSILPEKTIYAIKQSLKKNKDQMVSLKDIIIQRNFDYGFVYLLMHIMNSLRIPDVLNKIIPEKSNLIQAMIIGKIITKGSKLSIYNYLKRNEYVAKKLNIDISKYKVEDFYDALGELHFNHRKVEKKWSLYHKDKFENDNIFLYDVTSSYFEGTKNELSAFGHDRDKKKGKKQINIGLITNKEGFPLKIQTFKGNVNDHLTVQEQIEKIIEDSSSLQDKKIVFIGDRGMKIRYNLDKMDDNILNEVDYITGLTVNEIENLEEKGIIQMNLFSKELAEIEHEDKRYVLSLNPDLKIEKKNNRDLRKEKFENKILEIYQSFEKRRELNLENIERLKNGHKNKKLVTKFSDKSLDNYKYRVKKLLDKYKMSSYYKIDICNEHFDISYDLKAYKKDESLDGKYVLETTISKEKLSKEDVRKNYKNLKYIENAFREIKNMRIEIRPIFHRRAVQTCGHSLLCMFSYSITKAIGDKIFPWLKEYNKSEKTQLAMDDIIEELKMIKVNELNIGKQFKDIKFTEFNEIQTEIFDLFGIKKIKE